MKNSASGHQKAYGQPYLASNAQNDGSNHVGRASNNQNLKSYINELKKASNANKSGGKRGHSSTRNGAQAAGTTNVIRQSQQAVVQTYGQVMPQTSKNGQTNQAAQFAFDYQGNVPGGNQGSKQSRGASGVTQSQLSELALKDNVTGALLQSSKNGSSNLTQLVSPSQTFARSGSRSNGYSRALSNGQIPQSNQNTQAYQLLSPSQPNVVMPASASNQFAPLAAAASAQNTRQAQQQQFLAGFISPQNANGQVMNQTHQNFNSQQQPQQPHKINTSNASSKAFQYLQKKGNLHSNTNQGGQVNNGELVGNAGDHNHSHLIKRIGSGRQSYQQNSAPTQHDQKPTRKSNTRGGTRNNQSQVYNNSQALVNHSNFSGPINRTDGKIAKQASDNRIQKDVIIRKNSSKSLLPHSTGQQHVANNSKNMPNISNIKSTQNDGKTRGASQGPSQNVNKSNQVLQLNTESMDRETANTSKVGGSHHKRVTSHPNSYVKVQNSEVASAGTAEVTYQGGLPSTNNYTTAGQQSRGGNVGERMPHTLGNTLGGNPAKQSLNMSNYGGYFSAIQRDSSLNENGATLAKTGINLTSLIRQNLLEEDGIEDLHFYFVSFQQHKKQILQHQKKRQEMRLKDKASNQGGKGGARMVVPKIQAKGASQDASRGRKLAASSSGSTRQMLGSTTSPASQGMDTTQNKTIESCDDEEFF